MNDKKNTILRFKPDELVKVSIEGCTIMRNDMADLFMRDFATIFCRSGVLPYIEKFSGDICKLKESSKCGKYRTGMIFKQKEDDSCYYLIVEIKDVFIYTVQLSEHEYTILHEKCLDYMNWISLPIELSAHTGMYSYGIVFETDNTGIVNNTINKENIDNLFEIIEELPNSVLFYLMPEIYLRGDTKYEEEV